MEGSLVIKNAMYYLCKQLDVNTFVWDKCVQIYAKKQLNRQFRDMLHTKPETLRFIGGSLTVPTRSTEIFFFLVTCFGRWRAAVRIHVGYCTAIIQWLNGSIVRILAT